MSYFLSRRFLISVGCGVVILLILFLQTPTRFIPDSIVTIPEGSSFDTAAEILHTEHIISSPRILRVAMLFFGGAPSIKAGDYFFDAPVGSLSVARRLAQGNHNLKTLRVLIPEGSSSKEMGELLAARLPLVTADVFTSMARQYEGYLFPDTYFFLPTATSGDAIALMQDTFLEKTTALSSEKLPPGATSWSDVVTMASILEEEARGLEDKQIVAGILWKRIRNDRALQVDAPFYYLFGKASHELTGEELDYDSPYNTYLYRGLPPTPISSPGLESIEAALTPIETKYWFYLTGTDGSMYYAETFDEHLENKRRYLD
ncbi:MAG: endolytic transglycosylase MltG [Candidatus Pacebacteria bacterium]|nr:endolytic transglycosylase MltG [Candidatus Paceibacterota bacterium]